MPAGAAAAGPGAGAVRALQAACLSCPCRRDTGEKGFFKMLCPVNEDSV